MKHFKVKHPGRWEPRDKELLKERLARIPDWLAAALEDADTYYGDPKDGRTAHLAERPECVQK